MSIGNNDQLFELTNVLGSIIDPVTNSVTFTTGDAVNQEQDLLTAENMQHIGFASRPSFAVPGTRGPSVLSIKRRTGDLIIASRDQNSQAIYGNLGPGETCLYAGGIDGQSQGKVLLKSDGSVNITTTADMIGPPGTTSVANTPGGMGVLLRIDPTGLKFSAPWGSMTFDMTGFHITTVTGASFDLANINSQALGIPLPIYNNCRICAGSITLDAPTVSLGPSPTNGGVLGYFPAVFGLIPPVSPLFPINGVGVGAVVVEAASSTKVLISA